MTPLPAPLGGTGVVAWRLDQTKYAPTWESGEGAYLVGGRWNSKGVRAVYCSIDPACAILEVAVHKGFRALDTVPHVLTEIDILDAASVLMAQPATVTNANWLRAGIPSAGQQAFGDESARPSQIPRHSKCGVDRKVGMLFSSPRRRRDLIRSGHKMDLRSILDCIRRLEAAPLAGRCGRLESTPRPSSARRPLPHPAPRRPP